MSNQNALRDFYGTAAEFFELVSELWSDYGVVRRTDEPLRVVFEFVTGGWSENERLIGEVSEAFASVVFHSAWRKGGWYEYSVTGGLAEMTGYWGRGAAEFGASR